MPWVRLDDSFPEHPKVLEAGGEAGWLHVCALAYCNRNTTDGLIHRNAIPRLSDRKNPLRLADRLVEVGIWERDGADYRIHDHPRTRRIKIPISIRRQVIARDAGVCGICGGLVEDGLELDHIRPVARGGQDTVDNLRVSHGRCNRAKGATFP